MGRRSSTCGRLRRTDADANHRVERVCSIPAIWRHNRTLRTFVNGEFARSMPDGQQRTMRRSLRFRSVPVARSPTVAPLA